MPEDSKQAQLDRSHRRDSAYWCPTTGDAKRVCSCRPCMGRRNRRKGQTKQLQARKGLGIQVNHVSQGGNEESWGGHVRVEVKAGKQVSPIRNAYKRVEQQSEERKAIGDPRPFVGVFMPDDFGGDGIVAFRLSQVRDIVWAMSQE